MEVWIEIPSIIGYEASSYGRIRNKKTGRILKQSIISSGYLRVCIHSKTRLVHRLIAESFYKNINNHLIVHHKDNDKKNNNILNLEYTTQSLNVIYAYRDGLIRNRSGVNNPNYKNGLWIK